MERETILNAQGNPSVPSLLSQSKTTMPSFIPLDYHMHSTFSEDVHATDQVGLHLDQALKAIHSTGLKSVTHFGGCRPRPLPLEQ